MHLVMIGGSDAGISAALRVRELDPRAEVTVVIRGAERVVTGFRLGEHIVWGMTERILVGFFDALDRSAPA